MKGNMRNLRTLGICILLLVTSAVAQRRWHDPLTDAEADQLREVAQEPDKRIKLFIKFAQARIQAIEQLRGDPKMVDGRGKQIHDLLEDFAQLVNQLDDNVDMYARRKDEVGKSLGQVIVADSDFQLKLRALKDAAKDPKYAAESKSYEFALQDAMDAVDGNEQDTRDLMDEIAKQQKEAKEAEKKKKSKD
jgi:hypothetical protein